MSIYIISEKWPNNVVVWNRSFDTAEEALDEIRRETKGKRFTETAQLAPEWFYPQPRVRGYNEHGDVECEYRITEVALPK